MDTKPRRGQNWYELRGWRCHCIRFVLLASCTVAARSSQTLSGLSIMFWLTSICSIAVAGIALRILHTSDLPKTTFYIFLTATLCLFNLAIAVILACFWIDAYPWSQPKMLAGLIAITFDLALLIRRVCPAKLQNMKKHRTMLKTYSIILVAAGFIGGLIFGMPALTRNYIIKSDRWADIATAITVIEITSL